MIQEAALFIAMPFLQFCVHNRRVRKQYMLMMSSDYERTDWKDTVLGLQSKLDTLAKVNVSTADVQTLLNQQKVVVWNFPLLK